MVYLLHFDTPIGHVRHYAGATDDARLERDLLVGDTSRLQLPIVAAARERGVVVTVARTWSSMYRRVRELPYANQRARLCPTCIALSRERLRQ